MRLIDADMLLDRVEWANTNPLLDHGKTAVELIKNAPTIEPEQRWIPCSERVPDTTDFVLTINIVSQCGVYRFDGDCWLDYDGLFVNEGIRAWMPLPEPYKGGSE